RWPCTLPPPTPPLHIWGAHGRGGNRSLALAGPRPCVSDAGRAFTAVTEQPLGCSAFTAATEECAYTHTHTNRHTHIHTHTQKYTHTHIRSQVCRSDRLLLRSRSAVALFLPPLKSARTHTHTQTDTHTDTHTHKHTHTHTFTHTPHHALTLPHPTSQP